MKRSFKWFMAIGALLIAGRLDAQEPTLLPLLSDGNGAVISSPTNVNEQVALALTWLTEAKPATNPLGVQTKDLASEFAGYVGVQESGVLLHEVPQDSAGYSGGLRSFDIVLSADGNKFESAKAFDEFMASKSDSDVQLKVFRKGETKELKLHVPTVAKVQWLVERLHPVSLDLSFVTPSPIKIYKLGIVSSPVDDVLRSHLNLPAGEGVVLTEVTADSAAAKVGCEVNDVLLELDGKRITSHEKLREHLQEIGEREVPLKLLRRGKSIEVKVQPQLEVQDQMLVNPSVIRLGLPNGLPNQINRLELGEVYGLLSAQIQNKGTVTEQIQAIRSAIGNVERLVQELEVAIAQQAGSEKPLSDSTKKPE